MRNYSAVVVTFICLISFSFSAFSQSPPKYIKGGQYFDVDTQQMVSNEGILVRGGRFYEIGDRPVPKNEGDYEVITLEDDEYILAGIVDVHAHFRMDAFGSEKENEIDEFKYNSLVYLANGVTSAFANGVYYPHMELAAKRLINSGKWAGPRIWASGPYFGSARPDWKDYSKEEIYEQVDHWVSLGVDGFKTKGGDPETVKHLVNRAHYHGLTVAGHLGSGYKGTTNAITAIDAGIDRVEHILGGFVLEPDQYAYPVWNKVDTTSADFKKTVHYYLDHNVYFDATINAPVYFTTLKEGFNYWKNEKGMFTPYVRNLLPPREEQKGSDLMDGLYKAMLRSTKAFYDAGGGDLITLGTDAPTHGYYLAGFGAHREMHAMVMAGIPERAVLKIASQNGANALGKGSLLGSIETGKLADLYVVKGNPLEDITNTRNVKLVMKSGEIYHPNKLLEQVKGNIGPESELEVEDWFKYPELMEEAGG
ncbi:amidohydrolase family protein [Fodinibius saliphilus]|uniref:amidohydrolase family protein n=1 Tax=Fodinibius saliphilus TaxID=1920650 RepID=UPI00110937BB|nr:amidohydrolase family protein [Fodinibius saliphilus]